MTNVSLVRLPVTLLFAFLALKPISVVGQDTAEH